MLKHYVTFLYPGSFVAEESSKEIDSREGKIKAPKTCFAYYLWDREEHEVNGELLKGSVKNKSGLLYFGEVMTIQEVEEKVPNNKILISNMRINKWNKVVRTRTGNFQPLRNNDIVIAAQ